MIKAEWGTKRQCPKCGLRFYDLTKDDPVTCIGCGHSWVPEPILKSKQSLSFETDKGASETPAKEGDAQTDDLDLVDADSEEPADDDHDLGGDDLSDVVVDKHDEEDS